MMNIFLLFVTTLLMIGYYVLYSPSQNLPHLQSESIIETADLQGLAERVVTQHNKYILNPGDIEDYEEHEGISNCYFCLTSGFNYDSGCTDGSYHVWLTNSKEYTISQDKYSAMIEIIGKAYSLARIFGIYVYDPNRSTDTDYFAITKGFNYTEMKPGIKDGATQKGCTLEPGQLVYFTQVKKSDGGNGGGGNSGGGDEPIPETNDCNTYCAKLGFVGGEVNNSRQCRNLSTDSCLCYVTESCSESQLALFCGTTPAVYSCESCESYCIDRGAQGGYLDDNSLCMCDDVTPINPDEPDEPGDDNAEENDPCSTYTHVGFKALQSETVSQTIQQSNICGTCMTLKRDSENCIQYCVPNPDAVNNRSCRAGNTADCPSDKKAIYFHFGTLCGTPGAIETECFVPDTMLSFPTSGVSSKIKEFVLNTMPTAGSNEDKYKFHCLECPYGVNYEESINLHTVVCKPQH